MTTKQITQTKNKATAKTFTQSAVGNPLAAAIVLLIESFTTGFLETPQTVALMGVLTLVITPAATWLHNTFPTKEDRARKAEVARLTAEAHEDRRNARMAKAIADEVVAATNPKETPADPPKYV